jgi:hypothetical protein
VVNPSLENAFRLWIPPGEHLQYPSERENITGNYLNAIATVDRFLEGKIHPSDFLEMLDGDGVDVDSYLDDVTFNLNHG